MDIYKLQGYTTVGNDWKQLSTLVFENQRGEEHTIDVSYANITEANLFDWLERGMLIQRAMPTLSADDRELLISGLLPEAFDSIFDGEE